MITKFGGESRYKTDIDDFRLFILDNNHDLCDGTVSIRILDIDVVLPKTGTWYIAFDYFDIIYYHGAYLNVYTTRPCNFEITRYGGDVCRWDTYDNYQLWAVYPDVQFDRLEDFRHILTVQEGIVTENPFEQIHSLTLNRMKW